MWSGHKEELSEKLQAVPQQLNAAKQQLDSLSQQLQEAKQQLSQKKTALLELTKTNELTHKEFTNELDGLNEEKDNLNEALGTAENQLLSLKERIGLQSHLYF